MGKRNLAKIIILIAGDILFLYAALRAGLFLRYAPEYQSALFGLHLGPFSIIFAVWILFFGAFGLYELKFMKNGKNFIYRLLYTMGVNVIAAAVIFYFYPYFEIEPRRNLLIIASVATIFILFWRYFFNLLVIRAPSSRLLFFGTGSEIVSLADWLLKNPQLGSKPVGFISNGNGNPPQDLPLPVYSLTSQKLPQIVQNSRADAVVISYKLKEDRNLTKILFQMIPRGIGVLEFARLHEMTTGKIPHSLIGELWFLENLAGIRKVSYEFSKRLIDLLLAALCAVPAALTFPLIAFAIKADSKGPVFYRQKRIGRHGRTFELIKYRSMVDGADKVSGLKNNDESDSRLTRIGKFLRSSYLDELPQIINILKGEMSFTGPRPERPEYVEVLKEKIPFYEMRLLAPPGLTGWAQINMEDDASVEDAPEKMQYDLYYIKNRSFVLDLLIILRTISALLRRQGR